MNDSDIHRAFEKAKSCLISYNRAVGNEAEFITVPRYNYPCHGINVLICVPCVNFLSMTVYTVNEMYKNLN